MKKKLLLTVAAIAAVAVGVVGMSAFEAHVINVTAHIENALSLDTYGIDFGTVFPQENITDRGFTVALSESFRGQDRANQVAYKIVQKDKPWTLNFGEGDDDAHNRSLLCVDPDTGNLAARCVIADNVLTITTDGDKGVEDLFGANETFSDVTAPRMVIPMGGNFTIETKVTADPQNYYQAGGILVYGSDGNVVRLEITNWSGSNQVYMESQENEVKVGKAWASIGTNDTVYLKMTRTGNDFAGFYSMDGVTWTSVPVQTPTDFTNEMVGNHPKVGLSAISADPNNPMEFPAEFDYVTFNGDYLSLCRFLSKEKVEGENDSNDRNEPSYFIGYGEEEGCYAEGQKPVEEASGVLNQDDMSDSWIVDLKVPPVSGYVAQDWPESCLDWVVEEDAMDYGCDLWIEVTGIDEEVIEEREVTSVLGETWASSVGNFSEAWQADGRWGDGGTTAAEKEVRVGMPGGSSPIVEAHGNNTTGPWRNDVWENFTLTYISPSQAMLTIGDVSIDTGAGSSIPGADGKVGLTIKTKDSGETVMVQNVKLDGMMPIGPDSMSASNGAKAALVLGGDTELSDGFTVTGQVKFSWSSAPTNNESMGLLFQIEN